MFDHLVFKALSYGLTGLLALAALVLFVISLRIRTRETPQPSKFVVIVHQESG